MNVGFYSPLPPARTGVANYSSALMQALMQTVTQALAPQLRILPNRDGDVNLYHLGNNQLHAAIYREALERPGITVLHDAVLQHFALGFFSRKQYIDEFTYNYGEWTRDLADSMWENRSRSAAHPDYFRYPMLKRIAERSRAIIVHNPAARDMVLAHAPSARIVEVPHIFIPPVLPRSAEVEALRGRLGGGPLFGVFGHLRESKRLLTVLRVFARLNGCTLLLAGAFGSSDLERAVQPYLELPNIKRLGYMTLRQYWTAANAVDACINLRYPTAGETSGVSIGFMGVGKAVVMTDSAENANYPESACIKIGSGLTEAAELEAVVRWLAERRSTPVRIGNLAADHIRDVHSPERVAELYREALTRN